MIIGARIYLPPNRSSLRKNGPADGAQPAPDGKLGQPLIPIRRFSRHTVRDVASTPTASDHAALFERSDRRDISTSSCVTALLAATAAADRVLSTSSSSRFSSTVHGVRVAGTHPARLRGLEVALRHPGTGFNTAGELPDAAEDGYRHAVRRDQISWRGRRQGCAG